MGILGTCYQHFSFSLSKNYVEKRNYIFTMKVVPNVCKLFFTIKVNNIDKSGTKLINL
jgi:hypothetical protein